MRNIIREEVLDLTLANTNLSSYISGWHASGKISLSNHQHIKFNVAAIAESSHAYRDSKNTKWLSFYFIISTNYYNCLASLPTIFSSELLIHSSHKLKPEKSTFDNPGAHCPGLKYN
uniref:Uncharacterized protein n=1 Tax=Glossina austeni TaxID=7395 RepID=A0A1A9URE0_GLOAU